MKLFCFPFSGGSASVYLNWFRNINNKIEIHPVELAGRNKRFSEPLKPTIDETVQDLFKRIRSSIDIPYALFGHSLGCLIIYELVQVILNDGYPVPEHIFLSGGVPPHYTPKIASFYTLPDREFLDEIIKMGGASSEFIQNKELQEIFLPIIRSDYKMYETFQPKPEKFIFPCSLTVLAGTQDEVSNVETAQKWSEYTNHDFELEVFEGDHFFIKKHGEKVVNIIERNLSKYALL